jgi:Tfp pilus assembly protein PilO
MSFRKFIKKYQQIIISVAILLVCIGSIIFGIIPAIGKLLALWETNATLTTKNQALRLKASVLASLDEETQRQNLNALIAAVPPDKSLPSIFSTIDGLSVNTGVAVTDFILTGAGSLATESARKQSGEEQKLGSNLLPFSVSIIGSYEQIRNFLESAVAVRRFFRVRQFELSFTGSSDLTATLGMDAYYASLPTHLGQIEQRLDLLTLKEEEVIAKVSTLPLLAQEVVISAAELSSQPAGKDNPFAP